MRPVAARGIAVRPPLAYLGGMGVVRSLGRMGSALCVSVGTLLLWKALTRERIEVVPLVPMYLGGLFLAVATRLVGAPIGGRPARQVHSRAYPRPSNADASDRRRLPEGRRRHRRRGRRPRDRTGRRSVSVPRSGGRTAQDRRSSAPNTRESSHPELPTPISSPPGLGARFARAPSADRACACGSSKSR